jgi:hypothetical protein
LQSTRKIAFPPSPISLISMTNSLSVARDASRHRTLLQ